MKLLYCSRCGDVFNLKLQEKTCSCGETSGSYTGGLNAVFKGKYAKPLGFANNSFVDALKYQPSKPPGRLFTAFVIEKNCETFAHKDKFTRMTASLKKAKSTKKTAKEARKNCDRQIGVVSPLKAGPKYRCKKCDDVIQSKGRHDFVWCKCGAIAVDGGNDYTRLIGRPEDQDCVGENCVPPKPIPPPVRIIKEGSQPR